jgi:dolichol-phosphate mannosyltransferase
LHRYKSLGRAFSLLSRLEEAHITTRNLEFAIIVPILNERDNIQPLLGLLGKALTGITWEAVFVDDGSHDGSIPLLLEIAAANPAVRLVQRLGRRGLSTAVVEGMMATAAPLVGVIDGDLQHDETILPAMIAAVREGRADVAVGSRYIEGGGTQDWSAERLRASRFATWLGKRVIPTPTSDPMSGFFVTRRETVAAIHGRLSGIGFKILIDILASSPQPLRVVDVPYVFRGRVAGESKMGSAVAIEYLVMLVDKTIGRFIPTRLFLFLCVGGLGLFVHLATLRLALAGGASFMIGQTIAVMIAITFNFTLNNLVTYRDRTLRGWSMLTGLLSFAAVSSVGAVANVGVGTYVFEARPSWWLAGMAGAAMGAIWNYAASSFVTWRKR